MSNSKTIIIFAFIFKYFSNILLLFLLFLLFSIETTIRVDFMFPKQSFYRFIPCYGEKKYGCKMRLKFDYDHVKRTYRLYRAGKHNHKLDSKYSGLKWDKILDDEGPPPVEIVFTKCTVQSVADQDQTAMNATSEENPSDVQEPSSQENDVFFIFFTWLHDFLA